MSNKTQSNIQQNNYFNYRLEDLSIYDNYQLPGWIRNSIKNQNSRKLVYGCGFGQNIAALKKNNFNFCYGVDIEKSAINYCKKNNHDVRKLDIENLENPFPFNFDIILMSHVLEHFPKDDIIDSLRMIKSKFLNKEGALLIAVPNAQSNTGSYWAYEDWTHTTLFTSGSIFFVLKSAGFNNIEFLDKDGLLDGFRKRTIVRKYLLKLYMFNKYFWNKVTGSQYHHKFPQIFTFDIKVKAS